ncbi:rod-binding protein [Amaricoccus sp.]|uniref:rod-binding protein n=1 Tax=Amaricoccus sp. TaxID=1872485 RepID=UPI00261A50DB|nr:rod-binding protein [Amaricoccus sp.]HRO10976.1 rod-binding protein [Amaricoccus sp.]
MQSFPIGSPVAPPRPGATRPTDTAASEAAQAFEAAFLAEMLRHSGLNAPSESFGGGAGEEAFASLLTDEYARLLAQRGGIGLAERIFELLKQER